MPRRLPRSTLVLSVAAIALACARTPAPPPLDGAWAISSATLGGKDLPLTVFGNSRLQLAAGKYVFQNDTGEYAVIPGTQPAAMEIRGQHGPNAGKTFPAIFQLQADTLIVCYDLSGAARPKAFASDSGTQLYLVRYTRSAS
jgi:uncharacterized protein (TIGR03067 family)